MANSRLIAEGVDIPSVDAIVFADPTRSVIRCVQALGRALRLDVSGKTASLIVPVYVPPGADGENILGTPYEPVWAIACALAGHDHRILERLPDKANRLPRETSDVIQRRWHFDFTVHPERIAQAMDLVSFDPRDQTVSRSRRLGLAAAQSYRDQYGHLDVPADHTDPTGYRLGTFITTMRDARTAGRLEADWIAELDTLDMIWDKHDAAWRSRLAAAADYHHAHGHLAAPATTPSAPGSPSNATSPPRTPSMPPAPTPSPHSLPTGACPTARTGTANTTCSAPTSPPAPTRLPSPATPSWQG
ncbi:helicase associated domain-containing protein [Streptomyces scabiei]|uniref:helicase associated domain-containing protein n=1 Tax=Streptomyces scabiei TaxID=1930 RepID=UPI001FF2E5A5|nr:helicase associated domain-containing protein [Streptomyces sp. LBUM 1487]